MRIAVTLLLTSGLLAAAPRSAVPPKFSGTAALQFARRAVAFGPRPAGSPEIRKLQGYIHAELAKNRCEVRDDDFTAQTPVGRVPMQNIIARFPGTSGRIVAITGHYDTKSMPGTYFLGANDGGSSTGFLLELARVLARVPHKNDIYVVWLDGEEAFGEWTDTNGIFGSRHLARKWADDGTLRRVTALINVDMIGDRDLDILKDTNSSPKLQQLIWDVAARLASSRYFQNQEGYILDDHMPFRELGVSAVDLIDFNYGPNNSWWHTDKDTMDKLSAHSFEVVGAVVLETIKALD